MIKPGQRHPYSKSSSEENSESDSEERIQYESEFHTFAASKGREIQKHHKQTSSQQEDEVEDEEGIGRSPEINDSPSSGSSKGDRKHEEESFDMIEARIKKLENQLSKKLKKISPEREVDNKPLEESIKRPLKAKYPDLDHVVVAKENSKKQSVSPRQKKARSKEIKSANTISSTTYLPNKGGTKRVNETQQLRTIEQGKPNKASTRKLTQSHQGNFEKASQKQTIQDLRQLIRQDRRDNEQLKTKIPSKSKKKSCVQKQIEDMDYLKSKISSNGMTKLEKQIQLLKIVESIRVKLKRSINHKLNKMYPDNDRSSNKSKISTFLLHRGCPANYLN